MQVIETSLTGVLIIEPKVFGDERGFFLETFHAQRYQQAGIPAPFVQDNLSFSRRGVLRGLHFQNPNPQGKLVYVLQGEVFDVAVDIRRGSPNYSRWVSSTLSAHNRRQLWVPAGFAHGFCVVSETALFVYKCTDYYSPDAEASIRWDDPNIGVDWPVSAPNLSAKDAAAPMLDAIGNDRLPLWQGEP
jgi:dTDP-4-dehydrorhamnose 3,5-epimerase